MQISKTVKLSAIAAGLMLVASFSFVTAKAAPAPQEVAHPASMQKVVGQLQAQMQQIANSVPKQLAAQNANTQRSIAALQKQTQAQFAHLQSELTQLQAQTQKEIAQLQKEVQQEAQIK